MARLRDSYAGTSGAEGGFGALPLGLLAEMRTRRPNGFRGAAAVLPCATVSRTCHGGRMAANCLLVCYNASVLLWTRTEY